jgi:hypothetical protein
MVSRCVAWVQFDGSPEALSAIRKLSGAIAVTTEPADHLNPE